MDEFKMRLFLFFLVCCFFVNAAPLQIGLVGNRDEQAGKEVEKSNGKLEVYAVDPFGSRLFCLSNNLGTFSPEKRAKAISSRIEGLVNMGTFRIDALKLHKCGYGYEIVYDKKTVIMAITKDDAVNVGLTELQLAQQDLAIIKKAVLAERNSGLMGQWAKSLGIVLLVLIGMLVIVVALKMRYKKI